MYETARKEPKKTQVTPRTLIRGEHRCGPEIYYILSCVLTTVVCAEALEGLTPESRSEYKAGIREALISPQVKHAKLCRVTAVQVVSW